MAELTSEQKNAIQGITDWYKKSVTQRTTLVGYAGTGKTFLMGYIIKKLKLQRNEVAFCAYTGKAALVLKRRVVLFDTSTIHRLIYDVKMVKGAPVFELKEKLWGIRLIIVDEASMVSKEIYDDLMSFNIPVVFVGDEGQLPSIGEKFDVLENPDFRLTEIHRQAADNPVIHLSMLARQGKRIETGTYGKNVFVFKKGSLKKETLEGMYGRSDQVICGYNKTRKDINKRMREILKYDSHMPVVGDKLICLKNSWDDVADGYPLINGMTGYVENIRSKEEVEAEKINRMTFDERMKYLGKRKKGIPREFFAVDFRADFTTDALYTDLLILNNNFEELEEPKMRDWEHRLYQSFDYGYAITCHKSQGSQYENVMLINEVLDSATHPNWLYTGITRTEKNLILQI